MTPRTVIYNENVPPTSFLFITPPSKTRGNPSNIYYISCIACKIILFKVLNTSSSVVFSFLDELEVT